MPYKDKTGRLCGFLNVEEKEGSGKYVRRYFVLNGPDQKLQFYLDNPTNLSDDSQHPCGIINIAHISKVSESKKHKPKSDSCFVINHAGKTLQLQAENHDDMVGWIQELNNASKITVPSDQEKRLSDQDTGYKTEIAGGVVCKIPIKDTNTNEDDSNSSSDSDDSYSMIPVASDLNKFKAGYCVKQGGLRKNWKRRYFVVNESGFMYFSSDQSKEPIRTIPKSEILDVRESHPAHTTRDNLFEVVTSKRTFYVQCDTPKEVQEWISGVQRLLHPPLKPKLSRSMSNNDEEDSFPVMKVYPQGNWEFEIGTASSSCLKPSSEHVREISRRKQNSAEPTRANTVIGIRGHAAGASKSLSLRAMNPEGGNSDPDKDKQSPQRLRKQKSWFLW